MYTHNACQCQFYHKVIASYSLTFVLTPSLLSPNTLLKSLSLSFSPCPPFALCLSACPSFNAYLFLLPLISSSQYVLFSGRSTTTNLLIIRRFISEFLEKRGKEDLMYFLKVFDNSVIFLKSYFCNQLQFVAHYARI